MTTMRQRRKRQLQRAGGRGRSVPSAAAGNAELWAYKRARQAEDMRNMELGLVSQRDLMWFTGRAQQMKIKDSPL